MNIHYERLLNPESKFTEEYLISGDYQDDVDKSPRLLYCDSLDSELEKNYQKVVWNTIDFIGTALKILNEGKHLSILCWGDFQNLVAEVFVLKGYKVYLPKRIQNYGIHLIIERNNVITGVERNIVILRKFSSHRKIGEKAIRDLDYLISKTGASKGGIVTTSFLTKKALKLIHSNKAKFFCIESSRFNSDLKVLKQAS